MDQTGRLVLQVYNLVVFGFHVGLFRVIHQPISFVGAMTQAEPDSLGAPVRTATWPWSKVLRRCCELAVSPVHVPPKTAVGLRSPYYIHTTYTYTLPGIIMEVESHWFVEDFTVATHISMKIPGNVLPGDNSGNTNPFSLL